MKIKVDSALDLYLCNGGVKKEFNKKLEATYTDLYNKNTEVDSTLIKAFANKAMKDKYLTDDILLLIDEENIKAQAKYLDNFKAFTNTIKKKQTIKYRCINLVSKETLE